MDTATLLWLSFLAGLYAPVGAPCALVLYPGYISFLAGRAGNDDRNDDRNFSPFLLGCLAAAGVIASLLAGGFLFSAAIQMGGVRCGISSPRQPLFSCSFSRSCRSST